jgi:histidine triad (HIT) family protein
MDCIFCRIVAGEIPSERVYEDERVVAFKDIHPIAPVHVLVVPRAHLATLNEASPDNAADLAAVLQAAPLVADRMGVRESGYRTFFNVGKGAGQVVMHVHMHLVAGASLTDMMKKL